MYVCVYVFVEELPGFAGIFSGNGCDEAEGGRDTIKDVLLVITDRIFTAYIK